MKGKNVVVINGRHYDAVTGVAISDITVPARTNSTPVVRTKVFHDIGPAGSRPHAAQPAIKPAASRQGAHTSHAVHKKPQRSQTLHRAVVKKSVTYAAQSASVPAAKSPLITRFGQNKSHIKPSAPVVATAAPAQRAAEHTKTFTPAKHVKAAPATAAVPSSSKQLKERLIQEKMAQAQPKKADHPRENPFKKFTRKQPRLVSIATMSLATVVLGGYLTYVNMPNFSVRVASARAGIDAQFPEYRPDGYSFAGPVAYSPGEVVINFRANGDNKGYEITQRASNWDSQAVLDNFVTRESKNYLTYSEQGLTVYTYENKAAWVSGGVLYTIDGDVPLSSEQILRIAGSM